MTVLMTSAGQLSGFNLLFAGVIVILILFMAKGGHDGFVRTVFEMFSVLVATVAASFFAPVLSRIFGIKIPTLSFLIAYIILRVALRFACTALNLISKLPIINELNKAAGVLAGLFRGILIVWLVFIAIAAFSATEWGAAGMKMIQENGFLQTLYQNNLLLKLANMFF